VSRYEKKEKLQRSVVYATIFFNRKHWIDGQCFDRDPDVSAHAIILAVQRLKNANRTFSGDLADEENR
jgi:hypothetical protein